MSEQTSYIDYHNDYTNTRESLFLGRKVGLIENLRNEFPVIWGFYKQLKALDWDENEIDISSCRDEFKNRDSETTDLMIKTLAWQFEADSSAAHIGSLMMPFVNNTEMTCYLIELMKNECLTGDHDVLTPTGWKRISDVKTSDSVAQWDFQTKRVSFVKPSRVTERPHLGKMIHIYDDRGTINQIVTENHRLPVRSTNTMFQPSKQTTAGELQLTGDNVIPLLGLAGRGLRMTPQEALYIAVAMDGGCYGYNTYSLLLDNQDKIDRMKKLADQAGWKVRQPSEYPGVGGAHFFTLHPETDWYVADVNKMEWFTLDCVSCEWAQDFITEIQHWGNNKPGQNKANFTFVDTRAHRVATIAMLAGYHSEYEYNSTNVTLTFKVVESVACDTLHKEEVDYNGQVYCLTVPTGYFLIRHRNVISITGNCLHSLAYKVIVENGFENPEEFLQTLLKLEESFNRLSTVKRVFDETYKIAHEYSLGLIKDEKVIRTAIFKFWITVLALERIQFMGSFAITFGLAEKGNFVPIAKLVQKIFNEEFQVHVQADKAIISNEMAIESNFPAYLDALDDICAILKEVIDNELAWTEFLFDGKEEKGGIRKKGIRNFVLYSATDVYKFLGIENPYEEVLENPLPYMNKWATIDENQASPQEESVGNYLLGNYVNDMDSVDMGKYGVSFA